MNRNSNKNNDDNTEISVFKNEVNKFVIERNWLQYHSPKNLIQAISVEVGELMELFLFKDYSVDEILNKKNLIKNVSDEIADVFIYLICLINSLNLDLTKIFMKKMIKNKEKYATDEFNDGFYRKK